MSKVSKISKGLLSDELIQELDNKLTTNSTISYNQLVDTPSIPSQITEVPETLLSIDLQDKINGKMDRGETISWALITDKPLPESTEGASMGDVENYVAPLISGLQEEINGKMDIGQEVELAQITNALAGAVGTAELSPELLTTINSKIELSDVPPAINTGETQPNDNSAVWYKIIG